MRVLLPFHNAFPQWGLPTAGKFHGVFESVGMEEWVIDIRKCDEDAVVAAVDRAYQRLPELRMKLEATIPSVQASVLGLFSRHSEDFHLAGLPNR